MCFNPSLVVLKQKNYVNNEKQTDNADQAHTQKGKTRILKNYYSTTTHWPR